MEAVPAGEQDEVGVVGMHGDVEAGGEAAAGLGPRRAAVVGDDERRPAVDDGGDRRSRRRGGDERGP